MSKTETKVYSATYSTVEMFEAAPRINMRLNWQKSEKKHEKRDVKVIENEQNQLINFEKPLQQISKMSAAVIKANGVYFDESKI